MLDMTALKRGRLGYRSRRCQLRWPVCPRLLASAIRVANPTPETSGKQALTTLRLPLELGIRGVCAGFQASRQRGRVPNGNRSGRVCYTEKSRHDETAIRGGKDDDVAAQGAKTSGNRPQRRARSPQVRANQGSRSPVGIRIFAMTLVRRPIP